MPNVLITSAGRRVSLVRDFKKELNLLYKGNVYTTDMNPELSSACNVSDKYFKVPKVTANEYIELLLNICLEYDINLVVPTIDTELLVLAQNKQFFKEKGITVLVSDIEFVEKCRDKRLTNKLFDECGINRAKDIEKNSLKFPLFIKPYDGSCSKDIYIIDKLENLTEYHLQNDKLMFLEYLPINEHKEFTVDVYYDKNSSIKCIVPRERIEVRSGEVNKGITRKNDLINYIKDKLDNLKGAFGCITYQFFVNINNNNIYGIEINPRFGGGYPLSYLAGANFPKWIFEEYFENKEIKFFEDWKANLLMLRYDDEIIIENFGV